MKAYFKKYDNNKVVVKMEAPGALNAGGAVAHIWRDGKWVESQNHAAQILFDGFDYDEITEAEAMELIKNK